MNYARFRFLLAAGLFFVGGTALHAQNFDDEFDGGDINDRWLVQRNAVGSTEIAQEDGEAVVTTSGTNANGGLASVASFDPLTDGIHVQFVISEIVGAPNANGFLVGVVDDNEVFHRNTNNFGIAAFGQEPRTFSSDGFSLIAGDQNGSSESDFILDEGEAVDMESFQDGFTVTLAADEAGWSYLIEGLQDEDGNDQIYENTGTWADAGTTFEEIFGQDQEWHVLTANQSPGEKITKFDRITLGDPKPASDPDVRVTSRLALGQLPSFPQVHESSLTIRNAGDTQDLEISGIEIGGVDGDHFTVAPEQFPLSIAAGETGEVAFSVDNLGETGGFLSTFTVVSNDPAPEEDARVVVEVTASVINLLGPTAHFNLDDAEGTEMRDVTGFDRHGTYGEGVVLGAPGLADDGGTAITVGDGASASVSGRAFDEGTFDAFSVSLWFEAETVGGLGTLFGLGFVEESPAFALLLAEGELSWFVEEAVEFAAPGVVAGQAHHAAVTYGADGVVIYLDGVEVARQEGQATFDVDPTAPFHIGSFGALGYTGVIDDVQIYDRVLSAEDVASLHDPPDVIVDPVPVDSDGDGLSDEDEVATHGTDPLIADTDGDGLLDGAELDAGSDPLALDPDEGGTWDGVEVAQGTDPTNGNDDAPVWTVRTLKSRTSLTTIAHVEALIADGSFSEELLRQHELINFVGTGGAGNFEDDLPFDNIEEVDATNVDDFAVIATTEIFIEESGIYTFGFASDDGGRLRVDGVVAAIFDGTRGVGDSLGAISLAPGFHTVEILMFERGGGSSLEVYWDPAPGDSSGSFDGGRHVLLAGAGVAREDSDGDDLDDHWERAVFGDLAQDGTGDADGDGLTDAGEHEALTDPNAADTDADGLNDGAEVNDWQTDPLVADTDGDRRVDGEEVNGDPMTDPLDGDSDDDGFGDGFEVEQTSDPNDGASLPADRLGEPDESWHVLEALPTFNGYRGGEDGADVTFRLFIDFEPTDVTEDEREILWESGGGTVGFSLVYETGNRLVLRAAGNGGNSVATVEHVLTADELGAGEVSVVWTFDVDNGDPALGQTIALYVDDLLVGSDSQDMDPDWTGSNAASFGVGSTSFAAGGGNTALNNGVDFRSGTINLERGLQYFTGKLFVPRSNGDVDPPQALPSIEALVRTNAAVRMDVRGESGTGVDVEYSPDLEAGSWTKVASETIGGDGTLAVEDSDADRVGRPQGYYRLVLP